MRRLRIAAARLGGLVRAAVVTADRPPRPRVPLVLAALAALGLALAGAPSAHAETITVTGIGARSLADGKCTLLEALNSANNDNPDNPDCTKGSGTDTIVFAIPRGECTATGEVCRIAITQRYSIVAPVTIDGYSQLDARPNTQAVGSNAVLKIEVTRGGNWLGDGLLVTGSNVTIRGLTITGFQAGNFELGAGVNVRNAANVTIVGNHIGVDPTGTTAAANSYGIVGDSTGANVVIGGTTPEARNVISGNRRGIFLINSTGGARIVGNYIGTDAAGAAKIPNAVLGVFLETTSGVVVGGTTPGAGNVISGNGTGVSVEVNADGNVVQGNLIGTDATATRALGNGRGIYSFAFGGGATPDNNTIGGAEPGAGNVIAFNSQQGLHLPAGVGNAILGNRIFANGRLGIDLGPDDATPTPNDVGDGDPGPNRLQNYPVLTSAAVGAGTGVAGTLNSTPNTRFRAEFFANAACDPSGHGEGETFLGAVGVATNPSGNAEFVAALPPVPAGRLITATATNLATRDTSEFSNCVAVEQAGGITVTPTSGLVTREDGRVAVFTVRLESAPRANVTVALASSNPAEGSVTPSTLTFTPASALASQTVFVTGVDDAVHDGDVAYTIVTAPAQSADGAYQGLDAPDVAAVNRDDDPAPQPGPQPGPGPEPQPGPGPEPRPGPDPQPGLGPQPGPAPPPAAPPLPSLSIADARRVEGNAGTANLVFTVRLSAGSGRPVGVAFATQDLPASNPRRARAGPDYLPRRGTLTIPAGRTTGTIAVPIRGDVAIEPDESFRLLLSRPTNATLAHASALGTTLDNDAAPRLYIDDAERVEGQAGRAFLAFSVGLTRPSPVPVTVRFATANGTARAGTDFGAVGGTLTFAPGVVRRTILVPVVGDRAREPNEQLRVVLSRASVGLADPVGVGTILNDD